MRAEDLIVLQYSLNGCGVQVVGLQEARKKDLDVNLERGAYWTNIPIGKSGYRIPGRIIGVYDRTNTTHLNDMVQHATDATRHHDQDVSDE